MQPTKTTTSSPILDALAARGALPLLDVICKARDVTREDIFGRGRTKRVALARHELWWHLYTDAERPMTYEALGQMFGRNRTSTLRGVRVYHRTRRLLRPLPLARTTPRDERAPAPGAADAA